MKKLILLSISVFLGLQLAVNSSAKAQNFQIVASFGSTQSWGVPVAISYELDYFYPYHRFIHVNRYYQGRRVFFNVLLERHGQFVELTFGRGGRILNTNYFSQYPLHSHVCSSYCGYHSDYYFQQQAVCHSNVHRGHNHVNYYQEPRYSRYSRPNSARVVNNGHRGHGHGNGHYKQNNRGRSDKSYRNDNKEYRGSNKGYTRPNRSINNNSDRVASNRSSSSNQRGYSREQKEVKSRDINSSRTRSQNSNNSEKSTSNNGRSSRYSRPN